MELTFQKIVLIIAVILLILTLVLIGYSLSKAKSEAIWPPMIGDCPDYWVDLSGNGAKCVNTHSLGTCNIPSSGKENAMDFSTSVFTGSNGLCAKYTWAKNCGVTWDGINSGVPNPCSKSSTSTTK
jgi:hypothetical protein